MKIKKYNQQGFTLIELLVVLAILGMILGLVGPRVLKHLGSAKSDTAKLQIEDFGGALDLFYLENNRYPTTAEGLQALIQQPANLNSWNGPYLRKQKIPDDPWGNPYHFKAPGENAEYDLYSYGADNAPGGDKENKDILSWK